MMHNIENELVRQKDHILALINDEKYEEANKLLNFSEELWAKCTYTYKFTELKQRIRAELMNKRQCCAHWKQHQKWDTLLNTI